MKSLLLAILFFLSVFGTRNGYDDPNAENKQTVSFLLQEKLSAVERKINKMWGYKAQPLIYVKIDKKRKHPTINMNPDANREISQHEKHILNLEFNETQIKLTTNENERMDPSFCFCLCQNSSEIYCKILSLLMINEVNKIQEILLNGNGRKNPTINMEPNAHQQILQRKKVKGKRKCHASMKVENDDKKLTIDIMDSTEKKPHIFNEPITLPDIQGHWINSDNLNVTVMNTDVKFSKRGGNSKVEKIEESDDQFTLNGWVLQKNSKTFTWKKNEKDLFWYQSKKENKIDEKPSRILIAETLKNIYTKVVENNEQDKYEKSIKEVFTILDTDESGTISLQELETLYPDSRFAQFLFDRFDSDKNGELDFQELKNFINSNELATKLLNQLQEQAEEKEQNYLQKMKEDEETQAKLLEEQKKEASYLQEINKLLEEAEFRDELESTLLKEQENHLQKIQQHEDKHANQAKLLKKKEEDEEKLLTQQQDFLQEMEKLKETQEKQAKLLQEVKFEKSQLLKEKHEKEQNYLQEKKEDKEKQAQLLEEKEEKERILKEQRNYLQIQEKLLKEKEENYFQEKKENKEKEEKLQEEKAEMTKKLLTERENNLQNNRNVLEHAECAMCLVTMVDPTEITCGHNFCAVCLHTFCIAPPLVGKKPCPTCQVEFDTHTNYPVNVELRNVIENINNNILNQ